MCGSKPSKATNLNINIMNIKEKIGNQMRSDYKNRINRPNGFYSNAIIVARRGGVTPRNINNFGGCSSNYK